jgi:anti-anti-sigma factor
MSVEFRKDGITGYVKVAGRLAHGPKLEDFRARWTELADSGCTRLIINLTDVPTIDSSAMGSLVRCKAALDKNGGRLKIVGARAAILHALSLVRLDTMFEFYPDENTAAASFGTGK